MILTTKGRYAVMAIIDLCEENRGQNPISLFSIAKRQNISLSYLEQIFANLRKNNIVKSIKGPGGGYILNKKPDQISVSNIILATGEKVKMTACKNSSGGCGLAKRNKQKKCRTHDLWHGLESNIHNYLDSISVEDICKQDQLNDLIDGKNN